MTVKGLVIVKEKRENGTTREKLMFTGKSKTKQSEAKQADINYIIAKYRRTGQLPELRKNAIYADVSGIEDYKTSLETVMRTQKQFEILNSKLRNKFKNDPLEFIKYMKDEANLEESYKLGLRIRPAEVVPETPSEAPETPPAG